MINNYVCPNQVRIKNVKLLLCRRFMKENVDYSIKANYSTVICGAQKYCPHTKRAENTEMAKKCYKNQSSKGV